eukprot:11131425-Heterocapsa_arctica.AAC.1
MRPHMGARGSSSGRCPVPMQVHKSVAKAALVELKITHVWVYNFGTKLAVGLFKEDASLMSQLKP